MTKFYMIKARKSNKIPGFYLMFSRKIFFLEFLGGGASAPSAPASYATATFQFSLDHYILLLKNI